MQSYARSNVLKYVFMVAFGLSLLGSAFGADSGNLMRNAAPTELGPVPDVPDWIYQVGEEASVGSVVAGVQEENNGGQSFLFFYIKKLKNSGHDHVWWRQDVVVDTSLAQAYELTFQAKGTAEGGGGYSGVCFIAKDESFQFVPLITVGRDSAGVIVSAPADWHEYHAKFSPPPGTVKLIMRFGLDANKIAECGFRNIVLKKTL